MGNTFKSILLWVALCVGLMAAFNALTSKQENKQQIEYSQFIQQVNNGEVASVNIEGSAIIGYLVRGERTDKTSSSPMRLWTIIWLKRFWTIKSVSTLSPKKNQACSPACFTACYRYCC